MVEEVEMLNKAMGELREINDNIAALSGRSNEKSNRKSFTSENDGQSEQSRKRVLVQAPEDGSGGKRRVIVYDEAEPREKKSREDHRRFIPIEGPAPSIPRRSIQSSVVLPIETKSREETITKLKQSEKKEDNVRNRRLFGNLLMGTLDKFKKESKTVAPTANVQVKKQREVERRLELNRREEQEKINNQKHELFAKRREKEAEVNKLRRQTGIKNNLEEKETHFKRLEQFIQTQTKPPIFYIPAKHTLRTLELQKESAKNMEFLIKKCRERAERDLKEIEDDEQDIINHQVASKVVTKNGFGVKSESIEEDFEDEEAEK